MAAAIDDGADTLRSLPMPAPILIRSLIAGSMLLPPLALGPEPDGIPGGIGVRYVGNEAAGAAGESPAPGQIAEWVAASGDNAGLPFVVVDKTYGELYVFDSRGELQALRPATAEADTAGSILAANRVIVYVLPETDSTVASSVGALRYAAR